MCIACTCSTVGGRLWRRGSRTASPCKVCRMWVCLFISIVLWVVGDCGGVVVVWCAMVGWDSVGVCDICVSLFVCVCCSKKKKEKNEGKKREKEGKKGDTDLRDVLEGGDLSLQGVGGEEAQLEGHDGGRHLVHLLVVLNYRFVVLVVSWCVGWLCSGWLVGGKRVCVYTLFYIFASHTNHLVRRVLVVRVRLEHLVQGLHLRLQALHLLQPPRRGGLELALCVVGLYWGGVGGW